MLKSILNLLEINSKTTANVALTRVKQWGWSRKESAPQQKCDVYKYPLDNKRHIEDVK